MRQVALALMRRFAERGARTGWAGTSAGALRYAVRGPRGAPELLLLHGLGDSLAGWAQVVGPLAHHHQVHLVDLPGHGLSRKPPDWRLQTLASAVAHYARDLRRPLLVGHSLGGWIALRMALAEMVQPSGVVLVNPGGALMERGQWGPFRELISAKDRRGVSRYLEKAFHRAPLAMRLFPDAVIEMMWAEAAQGILDAVAEEDFLREAELASLRVPVRLIWGERDRLLPDGTLAFFRRALPRAEVVLLPRTGHLPHLEAPRALVRAILAPLEIRRSGTEG